MWSLEFNFKMLSKIFNYYVRTFILVFFALFLCIKEAGALIDEHSLNFELKNILLEHKVRSSKLGVFRNSDEIDKNVLNFIPTRSRRDMPSIHMKKGNKKLRTCANMNGILGLPKEAPNFFNFNLRLKYQWLSTMSQKMKYLL